MILRIHREGRGTIMVSIGSIAAILIGCYYLEVPTLVFYSLAALAAVKFGLVIQFFRNPKRKAILDHYQVLAPSDGKVVIVEETDELEYFKDKRIQISIFMSPLNVHVNRNPVAGVVQYFKYHPGKYLVAWHPKSSLLNERNTVVTKNALGIPVLYRQIAGAVARRIVCYAKEGDVVQQGDEYGFIKFGSRMDIFLPPGTTINVKPGDIAVAAKTSIATFGRGFPSIEDDE